MCKRSGSRTGDQSALTIVDARIVHTDGAV